MSTHEPLTEELLERLLSSATPEAYLAEAQLNEDDLPEFLWAQLDDAGMARAEAIRLSGINTTFGYQIFQGTRKPGRDHAIMLALGIGCDLRHTQRLLRLAGVSELWCKNRRDAIIIYCVQHGYSRAETDDELWRLGERTLLAAEER